MGRLGTRPTRDGSRAKRPGAMMGKKAHGGGMGTRLRLTTYLAFSGFLGKRQTWAARVKQNGGAQIARAFFFFFIQEMMVINRWASSLEKKRHDTARSRDEKHDPREARKGGTNGTKD